MVLRIGDHVRFQAVPHVQKTRLPQRNVTNVENRLVLEDSKLSATANGTFLSGVPDYLAAVSTAMLSEVGPEFCVFSRQKGLFSSSPCYISRVMTPQ